VVNAPTAKRSANKFLIVLIKTRMANWMRKNVKPLGNLSGVAAVPIPFLMKEVDPVVPRMPAVVQQARRLIAGVAPGEAGAGEVPDAGNGSS
jgi:hypothetical protein